MTEVTVTGYARGHDEGAGVARALHVAAEKVESAGGEPIRERIRGTVPGIDDEGRRVATEYDVTVSTRP